MSVFIPDVKRFPVRFDHEPGGSYQRIMRDSFVSRADEILARCEPRDGGILQVGFEVEYSVVDKNLDPIDQQIRDAAVKFFSASGNNEGGFVTPELGASQIELTTNPIDIKVAKGSDILNEIVSKEKKLADWLRGRGAFLLRSGVNPLVPVDEIKRTEGVEKYLRCPNFHELHQRPGMEKHIGVKQMIDVGSALIPGITNSVQINIDCTTVSEAIDVLNWSMAISPVVTLLGANAGIIGQADSGYADLRYAAWAISHDTRTWEEFFMDQDIRVGIPPRYYTDVQDYLSSVLSHPFFMEKPEVAFPMAIGTYWRDARIKFLEKSDGIQLVVEFRPLSTQSAAEEDFCLLLFYLGRVWAARQLKEQRLPIQFVRANKEKVMRLGRFSQLAVVRNGSISYQSFDELIPGEIEKGLLGLNLLGVGSETIEMVKDGLAAKLSSELPVDRFRSLVQNGVNKGAGTVEAIKTAIHSLGLISQ